MAQTSEEIAEILTDMRTSSNEASKDIKELLEAISSKINSLADTDADNVEMKELLRDLKTLNFRNAFEEIASKADEIKETFEKSSKINYNSLLLEISNMSKVFNESFAYLDSGRQTVFVELKTALSSILDNLQRVIENSEKSNNKPVVDSVEKLSEKISDSFSLITENINRLKEQTENFDNSDIKNSIENLSDNLKESLYCIIENQQKVVNQAEKFDTSDKLQTVIELVQNRFDEMSNLVSDAMSNINITDNSGDMQSIKTIFENLQASISDIKSTFESTSSDNVFNIMNAVKDLNVKIDDLKEEFSKPDYQEQILDAVSNLTQKFDTLSLDDDILEKLEYLKECFARQASEIQVIGTEQAERLSAGFERQTNQLKTIFDNIGEIKINFTETVESLKDYFKEIDENVKLSSERTGAGLSEKLTGLETLFNENIQNYDEKIKFLHDKIVEFANLTESSKVDTENKILNSLDEISGIKDELVILDEHLKATKLSSDEKLTDLSASLETNIESIIHNISGFTENVKAGVDISLKESIDAIESKFSDFANLLSELKETSGVTEFITDIYDKISSLKDELTLINTDVTALVLNNREETISALNNLKKDVSEFVNMDFDKILSDLRNQLDESFTNFSVDIHTELVSGMESISKLEQIYKETFDKLDAIDDLLNEKLTNDIELLNTVIESGIKDIKQKFEESVEDKFDTIKTSLDLALNNTKIEDFVSELKSELLEKFDALVNNSTTSSLKQDEILSCVSSITDNIKSFMVQVAKSTVSTCKPDLIHEKLDNIKNEIDTLSQKDTSFEIVKSIDDVNSKLENLVSDTLNTLHAKVDVLASNDSDLNVLNELDDIKEIIFEQRKFFEVSSDEKAAAIDKYLKDVLEKIENVDIERSSEDIKETILNALLSLVDQISFVEETEELKDFVEEKTDIINKNLTEVKDKLKKLINPDDDDFDYVYTLQDVESDIARLRLAINNMQGNDYSDITEEIGLASEQIEKLKDDIISISTRTNKLLLNSDESNKVLNDGFNNFTDIIQDNNEITQRLEKKLDNVEALAQTSVNADKIFHQTMMYLGEWVDTTTENIKAISEKADQISEIQFNVDDIKSSIPETSRQIDDLKQKFELQEEKIESLENKLEEILSKIEDNSTLQRKTEKIEKMLVSLSANIEKLTSYVDE